MLTALDSSCSLVLVTFVGHFSMFSKTLNGSPLNHTTGPQNISLIKNKFVR